MRVVARRALAAALVAALGGCAGSRLPRSVAPSPTDATVDAVSGSASDVVVAPPETVPPSEEAPPAAPPAPAPTPAPSSLPAEEWWTRALGLDRASYACVAPRAPVPCWSGDVTLRVRGRYTDDDSDTDLYQTFRVRYRREDVAGWSASMHLRVSEDVDGISDGPSFFTFDSVDDTYDSAVLARLYHLYANWRDDHGAVEQVRVGRQDVTVPGELFHVDGAHAFFRPSSNSPARIYAFGGIPTHLYDTSHDGDVIVGAGASFVPWRGASLEVADVYLEDESGLYGRTSANLASFEVSQSFCERGAVRAGYQQLDEDPRRAWGSFEVYSARADAMLRGALLTQILAEKAEAYDIDPYFAILTDLEPYWDASLSASKGLGCVWSVEAGVQARRLYDEDDRGTFNHDFTRVYGTVSARGWPSARVGVAVTGEWWRSEDGEDIGALGFEADWKPSERWRLVGGVDYALYRTDLYTASERYDSYGAYVRARYRPSARWEWAASLRIDTDDYDTYETVDLAVRWEF